MCCDCRRFAIGASQEHGHFPGTISLAPEQAIQVIESVGQSLANSGIRRLVSGQRSRRAISEVIGILRR